MVAIKTVIDPAYAATGQGQYILLVDGGNWVPLGKYYVINPIKDTSLPVSVFSVCVWVHPLHPTERAIAYLSKGVWYQTHSEQKDFDPNAQLHKIAANCKAWPDLIWTDGTKAQRPPHLVRNTVQTNAPNVWKALYGEEAVANLYKKQPPTPSPLVPEMPAECWREAHGLSRKGVKFDEITRLIALSSKEK